MNSTEATPPGLILGTGLTALGVMRSLSRAAIPAVCLSTDPHMESHSRWYRSHAERIGAFAGASELGDILGRAPWASGVLLPCSDHWAVEVTRLPASLRERFPAPAPDTATIEALIDKAGLAAALERASIPHPFTAPVEDEGHLMRLLDGAPGEVFLKPVDSQRFVQAFGTKAFRVRRAEAASYYRRAREHGIDMVLQEYVPGPADHHFFVDGYAGPDHTPAALVARRRLRMHPPDFGNSSCMVSVHPPGGAVDSLRRLIAATRYRGIFSAEFKLDRRDGLYKLLEVNCRPWWYVDFSTQCGVNVVAMAWSDALGRPLPSTPAPRVGTHLVYGYYDVRACRRIRREGTATRWACLRPWLGGRRAVFRWNDPAPAVALFAGRIRDWFLTRRRRRPLSSVP